MTAYWDFEDDLKQLKLKVHIEMINVQLILLINWLYVSKCLYFSVQSPNKVDIYVQCFDAISILYAEDN